MLKKIFIWLNVISLIGYAKMTKAITLDPWQRLDRTSAEAGYNAFSKPSLQEILITIILYLLGFVGLLFVVLIIYAGFQWMTSGGSEEKNRNPCGPFYLQP